MNGTIPIPKMLLARPRFRGMPVPFVNLLDKNRVPDFRAIDEGKRLQCMRSRSCGLCGRKMKKMIFAGGPSAAAHGLYYEPGMHADCVIYAMQTCPYILGRVGHAEFSDVQKRHDGGNVVLMEDATHSTVRPPHWVLLLADGYVRARDSGSPSVHLRPHPILWQSGALHPEKMNAADWMALRLEINTASR